MSSSEPDEGSDGYDRVDRSDNEPGVRGFVPDVIRRSLALKLGIALLLMGAAVGVAGGLGTMETQAQFKQNVNDEYAGIAEREASALAAWNQRNFELVETVSLSSGVQNQEPVVAREQFRDVYAPQFRQFTRGTTQPPNLFYVDTVADEIVASTMYDFIGDPLSRFPETVQQSLEGDETHVSQPYNNTERTGDVVARVAYVTPVPEQQGRYVVMTMPLESYSTDLGGDDESHTTVVDSNDRKMITEDGEQLLTPYAEDNGIPEAARDLAFNGSAATTAGPANELVGSSDSQALVGEEYVVGYSRVPETDWAVLVHVNAEQVYAPVVEAANRGFGATLVGVLFIVVAGGLVGRSLTSSLNELTQKTHEMRQGNLDAELSSVRIDAIGQLYDGMADMRDSLKQQIDEAERARKEAEVSRAEALEMNNYLQEKADEFSQVMAQTAAGDMTERMTTDGENDSMDRIAEEFNEMIEELEKTTGQLKSFSEEVAESGDVLLSSSESVRDASEHVAESIQQISDDAYQQKDDLEEVAEDVDDLVTVLESLQADRPEGELDDAIDQFRSVSAALQRAADTSDQMLAESENVAGAAEEQAAELNEVSSRAEKLKRYARPLSDILSRFQTESAHKFVFTGGPSQEVPDESDY